MFENYDANKYDLSQLIRSKQKELKLSDDIRYKQKMLEAFFNLAKGFRDLLECFETVCKFFEDRKWALKYIPLLEKVSEYNSDNRIIGELYYHLSEDLTKTREYFEKAEDTTDSQDLMYLAQSVLDCLGDSDWYGRICKRIEFPSVNFALSMKKNLGNNHIIKELNNNSVKYYTDYFKYTEDLVLSEDCAAIRNYIRDVAALNDLGLLEKIIIQLEQANVFHESIAEQLACTLNEQEWASEHYINRVHAIPTFYPAGSQGLSGSESLTIKYHQLYVSVFNSCVKHLSKPELAKKVLDSILPILETPKQFINYNFQLFDAYFHKHFTGVENFDRFAALASEKEEVFKIAIIGYLLGKTGLEMLQFIRERGFESDLEEWYDYAYSFIQLHYSEYKVYEFDSDIIPYIPLEYCTNDFVSWNQGWRRLTRWSWKKEYKEFEEETVHEEKKENSQEDILNERSKSLTKLSEHINNLIDSDNFKEYMQNKLNELAKAKPDIEIGKMLLRKFGELLASTNLISSNCEIKLCKSDKELYQYVEDNIHQEELNRYSYDLSDGTVNSYIDKISLSIKIFENNNLYKISEDLWNYSSIFQNIEFYRNHFGYTQIAHLAKFTFSNLKDMADFYNEIEDEPHENLHSNILNFLTIKYLIENGVPFDNKATDFINILTELIFHIPRLYITDNNTLIGVIKPVVSIPDNEYQFPGQKVRYRSKFADEKRYVSILHYIIDETFLQKDIGKDAFVYACKHPWERDTGRLLNMIGYERILQSGYEEIVFDDGLYREVNLHFSDAAYRLFYYIEKYNIKGFYVPDLPDSPNIDGIHNSNIHFTDLGATEIEWMKHTAEDLVESFEKNR